MKHTYLFYDIETTGLNPCFDQVLQFAAIRTDLELNELARHEFNVKLNDGVIPSPGAVITHHIGVDQWRQGISEFEAISHIHQLLNTPGTISLGYNTLGFDDEFLRFSFYRNLLPPYTHQYANQCARMDLYPLTIMYYLFKPSALTKWPVIDQNVSLKLENISAANHLAEGQAHSAIVDVIATLNLARKLIKERETWDYLIGYFDKNTDISRMSQLSSGIALLVNGKFGAKNNFVAPVLHLGPHTQYKNQNIFLRLDDENLSKLQIETIAAQSFSIRKKAGEKELLLPLKPRYLAKLSAERQSSMEKNQAWLNENPQILAAISAHHCQYIYPKIPNIDPDAALYELGFPDRQEEILFKKFHQALPSKKMFYAEQFSNLVRKEQALRIMGRHFFSELTPDFQIMFKESLQQNAIDFRGQSKLTLSLALEEAEKIKNSRTLTPEQQKLLHNFQEYFIRDLPRIAG